MKIGVCATNYKDWPSVAKYGYDFIEYAFVLLAKATDEEFEDMKAVWKEKEPTPNATLEQAKPCFSRIL